jgi:diacylglycerol kinase (ATP)
MAMATEVGMSRVIVIVNAMSGRSSPEIMRRALATQRSNTESALQVREAVEGDDIVSLARSAVEQGFEVVVAAGGDGTVSAVANGLVGSPARLAIIPLGTTNVLARELGIPLALEEAFSLLTAPTDVAIIDAMQVGDCHYFTQIGIGIDALMIRDTTTIHKKWLGPLAYLWTAISRLLGFQPGRYSISVDGGPQVRLRALQLLLANCGTLGATRLRWGPDIQPEDGRIDVCVIRAKTLLDYLGLAWSVVSGQQTKDRNIRYFVAKESVEIHCSRDYPVQGDGEVIGHSHLTMRVVPAALRIVVPARETRTD